MAVRTEDIPRKVEKCKAKYDSSGVWSLVSCNGA